VGLHAPEAAYGQGIKVDVQAPHQAAGFVQHLLPFGVLVPPVFPENVPVPRGRPGPLHECIIQEKILQFKLRVVFRAHADR
jgi:hypothetical protein